MRGNRITLHLAMTGGWLALVNLLFLSGVWASPRLISLAFNSAVGTPHQFGADEFAKQLVMLSDRRIAIDEEGGNALGSEPDILSAVRFGAIDTAVLTGSVLSAAVPEIGVFDIPFLFRDAAHAKAVAEGPVGAAISAKCADKGLVLLAIGEQGFRNITNSKHPIHGPDDLKGLKFRLVPNEIYQMTFKALGADVVTMDFPLVYGALKDGRVDGQENPLAVIAGTHLQDVQKYITMTGHFFGSVIFVANRATFEQLAPAEQAPLRAAAREAAELTWRSAMEVDARKLDELRRGGMDIVETVDRAPFLLALRSLEPEFEKRFGRETLAAIRSTP
jgi:tripartite ATP-independent transporter DctP family solute receptor